MIRMVVLLSSLFFCLSAIPSKFVLKQTVSSQNKVFEYNDTSFFKTPAASRADFEDTYLVMMPKGSGNRDKVLQLGTALTDPQMEKVMMRVYPEFVATLSASLHELGASCGALVKIEDQEVVRKTAATVEPAVPVDQVSDSFVALTETIQGDAIKKNIKKFIRLDDRHHESATGKKIPQLLMEWYDELADGREDVEIEAFKHSKTKQNSVIVRIKGSEFPDEVVVLGSHLDSIAREFIFLTVPNEGADDNASGTMTNLEVFKQIIVNNFVPKRTIEIHAYAAEEIGLVGSNEIAKVYKRNKINVVSMLQQDMNLYNKTGRAQMWFITNDTDKGLTKQVETLARNYTDLEIKRGVLTAGTSDHLSWTNKGFAAVFPSENPTSYNPHIHTTKDKLNLPEINWEQSEGFGRLAAAYLGHFAGLSLQPF